MRIGMIQIRVTDCLDDNLKQALDSIKECALQKAELCILPELWNTPFINRDIVRHDKEWDFIIPALQNAARTYGIWIVSGTIPYLDEKGQRFNRAAVINDRGDVIKTVDKLHLLEVHTSKNTYRESDVFTPGDSLVQVDLPWCKAGILICYDIRFPEAARLVSRNAKILIVIAGFNEHVGKKHWEKLLSVRAMENEVFVIGLNPAREVYETYTSYGHSMVCSPDGLVVCEMSEDQPWMVYDLDLEQVAKIRKRSPYWKLRREDLYTLEERNLRKRNEED